MSLAPGTPHLCLISGISLKYHAVNPAPTKPRSFDVVRRVNFKTKTMYLARLYAPLTGLIFRNCLYQNMSFYYVIFSRKYSLISLSSVPFKLKFFLFSY